MREMLLRESPVKRERRRKALRKILLVFLILIGIYVGVGALSHIEKFVVQDVEVRGVKIIDPLLIKNESLVYLSGNIGLFYAKGNIFLYSKEKIEAHIKSIFPRIWTAEVIDEDDGKIVIEIEEREGVYLWCGVSAPEYAERFSEKNCYFIDQSGFIFDKAPTFTDGVYFSIYGGIDDGDPIGQTIQTVNSMEDIGNFAAALADLGFPARAAALSKDGQHAMLLDIISLTGDYNRILWNETESLDEIYAKISSAIAEDSFKEEYSARRSSLLYIDTRFKGRVFYKFAE